MKEALNQEFIDRLRSESDIVSVISEYVVLKKKGKNYWGCCPFHHEKTPSFSVTPDKGFFYCFGCQTGGNVFNFLMKMENIGFVEAVKLLAGKLNIPLPEEQKSEQDRIREKQVARLYRVNEMARDFFYSCLTKTKIGAAAREYLAKRGVSTKAVETFGLGFAPPGWDRLKSAFSERGIDTDILLKAGLVVSHAAGSGVYDRFRNRIMFPICDTRGRVIAFGGRVIDDSQPKYLNSPETVLFNKRHVLYGLDAAHKAIRETGQAIVVEGYMDLVSAHSAGLKNVVASLGTAFTAEQARQLTRFASEIVFAYDNDAAGQTATARALATVRSLGVNVRIISIPEGKDPDEYIRRNGAEAFRTLAQNALPLLEYLIHNALANTDYSGLEGKISVLNQILPVLAMADNQVEIAAHVSRLAESLALDESAVRAELRKYIRQSKQDKNVNLGKNNNVIALTSRPTNAAHSAERFIIRCMLDDNGTIPYAGAQLSIDDFSDPIHRQIIELVFEAYNKGKKVEADAIAMQLSDEAGNELSAIVLAEAAGGNMVEMLDDCIKAVRMARLKNLFEQHRLRADELERMGDSRYLQELAESQRIKDEINKLHHS